MSTKTELREKKLSDVSPEDAAKILFLSSDPDHQKGTIFCKAGRCSSCKLMDIYADAYSNKSLGKMGKELERKVLRLSGIQLPKGKSFQTLAMSFSIKKLGAKGLPEDHIELLSFCEILEMMNFALSEGLDSKRTEVLRANNIPSKNGQKNGFFSNITNKIHSDINESLKPEEIFQMRAIILEENNPKFLPVIDLLKALTVSDTDKKFKDVLFYYIILNMQYFSLLNRVHTHNLVAILKKTKDALPHSDQRTALTAAVLKLNQYALPSKHPGLCIIFAMTEGREIEIDKDIKNIENLFDQNFKYDILISKDPTKYVVKDYATELSSPKYMFFDSLVIVFMANGDKTNLYVEDGKIHRRTELIEPFAKIDWLKGKPKLFFIQASSCRKNGVSDFEENYSEWETDISYSEGGSWEGKYGRQTKLKNKEVFSDVLVSYATMCCPRATLSHGSSYIEVLLRFLKEYGHDISIEQVLRQVHYQVLYDSLEASRQSATEPMEQSPYFESSLQKEFIFPK